MNTEISLKNPNISVELQSLLKTELGVENVTMLLVMDGNGDLSVGSREGVDVSEYDKDLVRSEISLQRFQKAVSLLMLSGNNSPLCGSLIASGGWGMVFRS